MTAEPRTPPKIWYVAHIFLWIISGLVCYVLWKDENRQAAKRHLLHSLWIGLAGGIIIWTVLL